MMHLETSLGIRLEAGTKKALAKLADELGVSLSDYIRITLKQMIRTPLKLKKGRST